MSDDPFEGCEVDDPQGLIDRLARDDCKRPKPNVGEPRATGYKKNGVEVRWDLARRLYVYGLVIGTTSDGTKQIAYPSISRVAKTISVGRTTVARHAATEGWDIARDIAAKQNDVRPLAVDDVPLILKSNRSLDEFDRIDRSIPKQIDQPTKKAITEAVQIARPAKPSVIDLEDDEPVNPRARLVEKAIETLSRFVDRFESAMALGDVKATSVKDFDVAMRLIAFLRGEADRRSEVKHVITLEQMQAKHAAARAHALTHGDAVVAGVLSMGDADADLEGVEVTDAEFEDVPTTGSAA